MKNTSQPLPKIDLEQLLRDGNIIRIKPQGYSMYPLFIPGRDEALIQQTSSTDCRRNDVVLYRRDQSILVLHRIDKITEEFLFPERFLPHFSHPRKPRMFLFHIRFQPAAPVLQCLLPDLHGYK